jgi:hypothetical protein
VGGRVRGKGGEIRCAWEECGRKYILDEGDGIVWKWELESWR